MVMCHRTGFNRSGFRMDLLECRKIIFTNKRDPLLTLPVLFRGIETSSNLHSSVIQERQL